MKPFVLNARIKSEVLSIVCTCTRWKLPLQTLIEEELHLFLGKSEFYHPENLRLRVRYGKLQLTIFCWKLLYRGNFRNWGFGGRGHEDDFGEASWKTDKWKTFIIFLHLMSLQISVTLKKILYSKVFSAFSREKEPSPKELKSQSNQYLLSFHKFENLWKKTKSSPWLFLTEF